VAADSQGAWRGGRRGGTLRFWSLVLVSLLLHTPLTPLVALLGLLRLLTPLPSEALPDEPPVTGIPIDLLDEQPGDAPPEAAPEAPELGGADPSAEEAAESAHPVADAGAEAADAAVEDGSASADAGADAEEELADASREPVDAGLGEGGTADAAAEDAGSIPDPIKLAGAAARVTDPNANVRLFIYTERVRGHPLAPQLASLIVELPQWKDFFGPAGIDPIHDIDRMLVVGPQFRDSSNIIALVQHHVPPGAMRGALEALVKRDPEGRWLDTAVPAALARADRAQRIFVMPNSHLVVVAPPSAQRSVVRLSRDLSVPPGGPGDDIVVATVKTPWRVFIGHRVPLPESIKWARVSVAPLAGGGARAKIQALDESPDAAARNAQQLGQLLGSLSGIGFGPFRVSFVESIRFYAQGSEIHGEIRVNRDQLVLMLNWVRQALGIRAPRPAASPGSAPSGIPSALPPLPMPLPPANDLPTPSPDDDSTPSPAPPP